MEKNLGFNNGDRNIDEVAATINEYNIIETTNHYNSYMNYFGSCSNISYNCNNDDEFEVF